MGVAWDRPQPPEVLELYTTILHMPEPLESQSSFKFAKVHRPYLFGNHRA